MLDKYILIYTIITIIICFISYLKMKTCRNKEIEMLKEYIEYLQQIIINTESGVKND